MDGELCQYASLLGSSAHLVTPKVACRIFRLSCVCHYTVSRDCAEEASELLQAAKRLNAAVVQESSPSLDDIFISTVNRN